jgi:hypothetical protein
MLLGSKQGFRMSFQGDQEGPYLERPFEEIGSLKGPYFVEKVSKISKIGPKMIDF